MKPFLLLSITLFGISNIFSQEKDSIRGYEFTTVKEVAITSVKNQANSGTCWCFSGLGFIEAELLRTGKGTYDLSEMYLVHKNYEEKARKFVRMNGMNNFGGGGSFADILDGIKEFGLVPEQSMTGLNYGENKHLHGELDALADSYVKTLIKNPNKKLSTAWFQGYNGILDAYLGKCPESFTCESKQYTPQSFAKSQGIDIDNYISITSFTHHPYYESFSIEVPDNWRGAQSYNIPMDEMIQTINDALNEGYTVAWASDVSEKGFTRKGIAIIPDLEAKEVGSDQAHWLGLNQKEREEFFSNITEPAPELTITQEMRQKAFDNYETTDDHGMLIYGTAKDQKGNSYYLVKNSWGTDNPYQGTWYVSEAFVKYKTISIVINKNSINKDLRKNLNLKLK